MRFLLALLVLAGCSTRPAEQSEWERQQGKPAPGEAEVELPAYPVAARLLEFEKGPSDFRFFIDPATLSVDKEGVVRYVLVARSSSGVENVTYEALRCETADFRMYAFGRAGTWARSRTGWRPLEGAQARQFALYNDYFCPQKVPIHDTAEGVRALQEHGHPFAKGFGGDHSLRRD
jgi:CNP1-like family